GGRSPRIVELIALTKAADAAHRRHALVPGAEAAIRGTARAAAVDGAPRIRIVGQGTGGGLRQHRRRQSERREHDRSNAHRKSPFMILQPATQHIPYYCVRGGRRTWRVSQAREPRLSVGRDCGTVQPVASDYRTDWARRTRRSRLLCTDRL